MSRFDRRLKPTEFNKKRQTNRRSSSPRPGEATCKLRPNKNNGMLGKTMFMGDAKNPNRPNIEIIESGTLSKSDNTVEKNYNNTISMDNVSFKNNQLAEKLKTIRDPNIRIIYNHEIRLNTIEATVDCLDGIKCGEVLEEQKKEEKLHVFTNLNNVVKENCEYIQRYSETFEAITGDMKKNESHNLEKRNLLSEKINHLENSIEFKFSEKMREMEEIKVKNKTLENKIEKYKEILKNIVIFRDENKDDLLREIENL